MDTVDGVGNLGSSAAVGYWLDYGRFLQTKVLAMSPPFHEFCARVLRRLLAYLQFICGHLLLLEFSEALFPRNCSFLELASSMAGTKLFLCLMYCTEVVFLKLYFSHLEQVYFCADYGTKQRGDFTCWCNTSIFIRCTALYNKHGEDLILMTPIFHRWVGFSQA